MSLPCQSARTGRSKAGSVGALALACMVLAAPATASEDFHLRAELWNFFQWNEGGSTQDQIVFRAYQNVALGDDWSVTFRQDVPVTMTNKTGTANPDGDWASGLGDVFAQAVVSTPQILPNTRLQAGLRVVFPTGGPSPFGGSTYQLGPMAGMSYHIEGLADGVTLRPTFRYLMSVAETEPDAKEVRKLQIYPRVLVKFDDAWDLEFWHDEPIVYDHVANQWFVPFDATLSWQFAPGAALKVGGSVKLTENSSQYLGMFHTALSFTF